MKFLLIGLTVLIMGCTPKPIVVKPVFPEVPATLMDQPKELKEISANASSSEVFETVVVNYGLYHELAKTVRGWQQWYIDQKEIYEEGK